MTTNERIARAIGWELFVIYAPHHDPWGYYRENAHGYTIEADAWKVTREVGKKYELYADSKPGDGAYAERVVLEPAPTPAFDSSLDAMAIAEATLTKDQQFKYAQELSRQLGPPLDTSDIYHIVTATASQRAAAFLAVMEGTST